MSKLVLQPPFYWGIDHGASGHRISRGWFIHTDPPYYRGTSIRFRFGSTSVEVGLCRKTNTPVFPTLDADAATISKWVSPYAKVPTSLQDDSEGGPDEGSSAREHVSSGPSHVRGGESHDSVSEPDEVSDGPEQT